MNRINFMYIRKKEPQLIQKETPRQKEPQQIYKNHKHTLSEIIEFRKSNKNSNNFKIDGLNTIETNDKTPEKLTKSKKLITSNTSSNFKHLFDNKYINSKSNLNTVEEDNNNNIISDKSRKRSFLLKDFSSNDIFSGRIKKISKYLKQEKKNTIIEENEIKQKKKEKIIN